MLIETARLKLKPFTPDMISDRYVSWLNDPDVVRFSEQRHRIHTRESCADFVSSIDSEHSYMWAIYNDTHIGNITAHCDFRNKTADVGILIGEHKVWGRGYGCEAWKAVCDWLLHNGTRIVTAGTMAANIGMVSIFRKSGMQLSGGYPGYFLLDDKPVDMVLAHRDH